MSLNQHKFRIGDPVWAKMKGFSPWPGKVCMPPSDIKRPAIKKQMHCVNFFGTNDFAWIEENNMKDYEQFKVKLALKFVVFEVLHSLGNPNQGQEDQANGKRN